MPCTPSSKSDAGQPCDKRGHDEVTICGARGTVSRILAFGNARRVVLAEIASRIDYAYLDLTPDRVSRGEGRAVH